MKKLIFLLSFICNYTVHAQFLDGVRQDNFELNMQERKNIESMEREALLKQLEIKKATLKAVAQNKKQAAVLDMHDGQ